MQHLEKAYTELLELSKTDGSAAIARRELYYAIDRINRALPNNCVGSDLCGVDGTCYTQVSGQGFCTYRNEKKTHGHLSVPLPQ